MLLSVESFLAMASSSSRVFSVEEVLHLLDSNEAMDDEVERMTSATDLESESDDEDIPQGDGMDTVGDTFLIPAEYLAPHYAEAVFEKEERFPAGMDSLLDEDFTRDEYDEEESEDDDDSSSGTCMIKTLKSITKILYCFVEVDSTTTSDSSMNMTEYSWL